MTVSDEAQQLIGKHFRFPDHFDVGREKIREFARAVKDEHPLHYDEAVATEMGYPSLVAPLTFLSIAGRRFQLELFNRFALPINIARVFHRDQKIRFHRPVLADDRLYLDAYLDSLIESHGTVITEVRSEITDAEGKPVMTGVVTMIGEAAHHEADAAMAAIASIGEGTEDRPL